MVSSKALGNFLVIVTDVGITLTRAKILYHHLYVYLTLL